MAKMRAGQVASAGAPFELVQREVPDVPARWVRIKVQACGICHSDSLVKEGYWPGIQYPRIPGHEIAGTIDAIGDGGVFPWSVGQRAGVGWFGGNCGWCEPCRRGDLINCQHSAIPGITMDGGYADYGVVPESAVARMPDELAAAD